MPAREGVCVRTGGRDPTTDQEQNIRPLGARIRWENIERK